MEHKTSDDTCTLDIVHFVIAATCISQLYFARFSLLIFGCKLTFDRTATILYADNIWLQRWGSEWGRKNVLGDEDEIIGVEWE